MAGRFTIEAVFKAIDQMSKPLTKMRRTADKFAAGLARPLRRLDRQMGRVHQTTKRVGVGMAALAAGAGAVGATVVRSGATFEQAIADLGSVSLKTRDQVAALEQRAIDLGKSTRFSATQVAQGMTVLARAGFDQSETLASIKAVMDAAAASGDPIEETAANITGVLRGMNLAASEAGRVADVMATASASAKTSIGGIAESMANVGATAASLGIPLEEVVSAVSLLTDAGLDSSISGNSLNSMLIQLTSPTREMAKRMRDMGVSFQKADGDMLPFPEVIGNLSKALDNVGGNMQQTAFLAELLGNRGARAGTQLTRLSKLDRWEWQDGVYVATSRVRQMNAAVDNAAGNVEKMAKLRMQTLTGDMLLLGSAVDGLKTALFQAEGSPLRGLVQGMTQWVSLNQELIVSRTGQYLDDIRQNWGAITRTLGRVTRAAIVFYGAWMTVKTSIAVVGGFRTALSLAADTSEAYGKAVEKAGKIAKFFRLNVVGSWVALKAQRVGAMGASAAAWAASKAYAVAAAGARILRLNVLASAAASLAHRTALAVSSVAMTAFTAVTAFARTGMLALNLAFATNPVGLIALGLVAAGVAVYKFWPQIKGLFGYIADKAVAVYDWFSESFSGVVTAGREMVAAVKVLFAPILDLFGAVFDTGTGDGSVGSLLSKGAGLGDGMGALMGGDDESMLVTAPGQGTAPPPFQMVPPHQPERRLSAQRTEHTEEVRAEVVIRDETGRAEVARQPQGGRFALKIQPSGAF